MRYYGLKNIENITDMLTADEAVQFVNLLKLVPGLDMEYLFDTVENLQNFIETVQDYGFSYDVTDKVSDFSRNLQNYMDQAESDYLYLNSDKIFDDDQDKVLEVIKKYTIYDENAGLAENADNALATLEFIHNNEYIFTILIVLAYMVISHFIAMHSMKKWDMVESIKDKE